jgi:hypothetical protein
MLAASVYSAEGVTGFAIRTRAGYRRREISGEMRSKVLSVASKI